jgi:tetratricopeptide (TPR) repeat protein
MPATPPLRERIVARFDDEDLRLFCADHFGDVGREFTVGMTLSERAQLLITRCARAGRAAALLEALEAARPGLVDADRDALLADLAALAAEPEQQAGGVDARAGVFLTNTTVVNSTIIGQLIQQPPPLPQPSRLHQLRAPVADFVGREAELAEIISALQPAASGSAMAISGLRGMGGIGKSELAFAVAQRLAPLFPDAQVVIPLRGSSSTPLTATQALAHVVQSFHPDAQLPDELGQLQALYTSCLHGRRVLILADDAGDAAQVRSLLPPAGCTLLITSRQRFSLPGMQAYDLETLPRDEAERLLLAMCPRIGTYAAELAQLCAYLPLALRVSAGVLANSTRDVPRYLAQLQAARLAHLNDPDDPADPQASVEASLALSYDALAPAAQAALSQLSVFPASFDRAAALAVLELEDDGETQLELLVRRSLLQWDAVAERFDLHDLVREFAATRLPDADPVRLRHALYYAATALESQDIRYLRRDAVGGLTLFDRERAQIDAGWAWAMMRAGVDAADFLLITYADATAHVGQLRYDVRRERIPQLEAAVAAARRHEDRAAEAACLGNLGNAYRHIGEVRRAIEFYEQDLVTAGAIGKRQGEGNALGNLGDAYIELGQIRRAIDSYEQALAISRELGNRQSEGQALGSLGSAYFSLGETRRAIEFYEQHLVIARDIGDRRGESMALGKLGIAYRHLGEPHRAIDYCEQELAISRELGDRQGEGTALDSLGNIYADLGEFHRAKDHHEQALVIARDIGDHRSAQNALGNLGIAYVTLGEPRRAIEFYEQHLAMAQATGDRQGEGTTFGNLGNAYRALGEPQRAIDYYEQSLAIARDIGNRRGEAITSWNLGLVHEQQGDLVRAAELLQALVDYEREIDHPDAEKHAAYIKALRRRTIRRTSNGLLSTLTRWFRRQS